MSTVGCVSSGEDLDSEDSFYGEWLKPGVGVGAGVSEFEPITRSRSWCYKNQGYTCVAMAATENINR